MSDQLTILDPQHPVVLHTDTGWTLAVTIRPDAGEFQDHHMLRAAHQSRADVARLLRALAAQVEKGEIEP